MIYDLDNNRTRSGYLAIRRPADAAEAHLKFDCRAGYVLKAVSGPTIEARRQGDVTWTNIKTSSLSLTPWDGTRQIFEIKAVAGVDMGRERHKVRIQVIPG
ncbi:MAG: hypothetical protein KF855_03795 [Acidobacteria bacterium]|nr:hypothetical protein [Acidobacteriota bacterium]